MRTTMSPSDICLLRLIFLVGFQIFWASIRRWSSHRYDDEKKHIQDQQKKNQSLHSQEYPSIRGAKYSLMVLCCGRVAHSSLDSKRWAPACFPSPGSGKGKNKSARYIECVAVMSRLHASSGPSFRMRELNFAR